MNRDFPDERVEEVRSIVEDVMEEQERRYEEVFETGMPYSFKVETHSRGPALVLYEDENPRPNIGGQFIRPLVEAGYIPVAYKDQATEQEGSRAFLVHVDDMEEDLPPRANGDSPGEGNILERANETVGVRAEEYGPPTENFRAIADMWSGYLGIDVTPYDYSQMMILAKIGRTKTGSPDEDTHQDQAGYSLTTSLVNQDGSEPGEYHGGDE